MNYDEYIKNLAIEQAQIQQKLKENQFKNAIEGFAKGDVFGAIKAIADGQKDKRNALLQGTMALNQPMMEMSNQNMQEAMNNAAQNNGNTFVGMPTGFAAPMQFTGNAQPSQVNDNAYNNYFPNQVLTVRPTYAEGYQTDVSQAPKQETNYRKENMSANPSLMEKFVNGANSFMRGVNENYNNGFKPENLTANQFAVSKEIPNTQLGDYQQQLKDSGKYSQDVIDAVADKKNSGYKEIDQWIKDNPQAYKPTTTQVDYYNKDKMGKLGEFVGTVARIAQNPKVQGAASGLITAALTGNPLAGYAAFSDVARKKDMSKVYQDYLAQNNINVNPGMFGYLSANDMNNMAKLAETRAWHEYMNNKYQKDFEKYMQNLDEIIRHHKEMESIGQQNADSNSKKADKYGNGKGGGNPKQKGTGGNPKQNNVQNPPKSTEPSINDVINAQRNKNKNGKGGNTVKSGKYVIMQAPNSKRYNVPVERIKEYKSYGGKIVG